MNYSPRCFPARMSALSEVVSHIDNICGETGQETQQRLRIELVIEELFTNTVSHGYGGDSEQPVWISAEVSAGKLLIVYQDSARACNPLDINNGLACAGGQGIKLIRQFSQASYRRENGRNTLHLTFNQGSGHF